MSFPVRIRLFCGGREDKRRWDDIEVSLGSTSEPDDEWDDEWDDDIEESPDSEPEPDDEWDGWDDIEESFGSIPVTGHEWDDDPAAWVRKQRGHDDCGSDEP